MAILFSAVFSAVFIGSSPFVGCEREADPPFAAPRRANGSAIRPPRANSIGDGGERTLNPPSRAPSALPNAGANSSSFALAVRAVFVLLRAEVGTRLRARNLHLHVMHRADRRAGGFRRL